VTGLNRVDSVLQRLWNNTAKLNTMNRCSSVIPAIDCCDIAIYITVISAAMREIILPGIIQIFSSLPCAYLTSFPEDKWRL